MTAKASAATGLRVFATVWVVLFAIVWVISAVFHIAKSPSTWQGFQDVMWWAAPWNIAGFVVNVLTLLPAFIAWKFADKWSTKDTVTIPAE